MARRAGGKPERRVMGESRGADRKGREGHPPSSAGQSRTMRAERVRKTDRGAHREAQAEPHKEATPCKETAGVGGGVREASGKC